MQKWFVILVLVAAALAVVAGCTESSSESPSATMPAQSLKETAAPSVTVIPATTIAPVATLTVSESTVRIMDNTFTPAELTVKTGSQVRWVNNDDHPHRVSFANGEFTAFLLGVSQSNSQKFARPGVYDYTCLIVPSMHGTITVVD